MWAPSSSQDPLLSSPQRGHKGLMSWGWRSLVAFAACLLLLCSFVDLLSSEGRHGRIQVTLRSQPVEMWCVWPFCDDTTPTETTTTRTTTATTTTTRTTTTTTTTTTNLSTEFIGFAYYVMSVLHKYSVDVMALCGAFFTVIVCFFNQIWGLCWYLKYWYCPSRFQRLAGLKSIKVTTFRKVFIANEVDNEWEILDELLNSEGDVRPESLSDLNADQQAKVIAWIDELKSNEAQKHIFRLLVMGQTSDGKSTVVNNLLARAKKGPCDANENVNGTTKYVQTYQVRGPEIHKRKPHWKVVVTDCPGLGDGDVDIGSMLMMVKNEQQKNGAFFDGLLMLTNASVPALQIGPKIMREVLDCAFAAPSKWDSIVFVGTKGDIATETVKQRFETEMLAELNKTQKSQVKLACVIDCLPLEDNRINPNLAPLWDKICQLIQLKEDNINKGLGSVKTDDPTMEYLYKQLTPILNEDQLEDLKNFKTRYQQAIMAEQKALHDVEKMEIEYKKREAKTNAERSQLQRALEAGEKVGYQGKLIGAEVFVYTYVRRNIWAWSVPVYIKGVVTKVDIKKDEPARYSIQTEDGSTRIFMLRHEFKVLAVDVEECKLEIGPGCGEKKMCIDNRVVYIDPDAGDPGKREIIGPLMGQAWPDKFELHLHLPGPGDLQNTFLICKRIDKKDVAWNINFRVKAWRLKC